MNYKFLAHINVEEIPAHSGGSDIVAKCMVLGLVGIFCFVLIWGTKINIHAFYVRSRSVPCNEIFSWLPAQVLTQRALRFAVLYPCTHNKEDFSKASESLSGKED